MVGGNPGLFLCYNFPMWLLFAFLSPALYAIATIFDNFLVNRKFSKHPLTLVFYTSFFNLLFIPILFAFDPPVIPAAETLPIFIILGFINIAYLYPYYRGLQTEDTSVAISFFAISRVFIPVLAFLIIGEKLDAQQYIGILLIMASVMALGLRHSMRRFRFSKALGYIGLSAFLLSFEGILMKILFEKGVTVSTAVGGEMLISMIFGMGLIVLPQIRKDMPSSLPIFIKLSPIFLLEEFFTFLGSVAENQAISMTSLSVVKGITMASPFFLLIYAWLGKGIFPSLFREDTHRKNLIKKTVLFFFLIAGIILLKE